MNEIGLFPLNLVLLPGERVPLHVFEERYKDLIGQCLDGSREFGLLLTEESGLRTIGTSAAVIEVLNRYDDGRLDVVVEGRDRFRVTRITEGHTYMSAEIQAFDDDQPGADPRLLEACTKAFEHVAEVAGADAEALEVGDEEVAWKIASQVDFGTDLKQELLEMRAENDRLTRLTEALDAAAELITTQRAIKERASGNGKVDHL